MNDDRLSLDSDRWESSSSMRKAKQMLVALVQCDKLAPGDVEDFIYEFEETDSFADAYYFALPYLTDLLTNNRESCFEVLADFCNPLMPANTLPPNCRAQIQLVRDQIAELMIYALDRESSKTEFKYEASCRTYVAGIAAIYMEAYVARNIAMPE